MKLIEEAKVQPNPHQPHRLPANQRLQGRHSALYSTLHAFSFLRVPLRFRPGAQRTDGLFTAARRRPSSHSHLTGEVYGGGDRANSAWRPRSRMRGSQFWFHGMRLDDV